MRSWHNYLLTCFKHRARKVELRTVTSFTVFPYDTSHLPYPILVLQLHCLIAQPHTEESSPSSHHVIKLIMCPWTRLETRVTYGYSIKALSQDGMSPPPKTKTSTCRQSRAQTTSSYLWLLLTSSFPDRIFWRGREMYAQPLGMKSRMAL